MMVELSHTRILESIDITSTMDSNKDDPQLQDFRIVVKSKNLFQNDFERTLFTAKYDDSEDAIDWAMKIHLKVYKHIKKKIKKRNISTKRNLYYTRLYIAQDKKCYLCGNLMGSDCTKDHVTPKSKGGPDIKENILLSHGSCNSDKDDRMPTEEELRKLDKYSKIAKQMLL